MEAQIPTAAQPLPIIIIGDDATAIGAAHQISKQGFAPVVIGASTNMPSAPHMLALPGRRATSVWGSLEAGFNVEVNTGETITGAAVLLAQHASASAPTGFSRLPCAANGETDLPGVQVIEPDLADSANNQSATRVVEALLRRVRAFAGLTAPNLDAGGFSARRRPTTH